MDLALDGAPEQRVSDSPAIRHVAVLGADYPALRPSLRVSVGQSVRRGDPLFADRVDSAITVTAPVGGVVIQVNRGSRRRLVSIVIRREGDEAREFPKFSRSDIAQLDGQTVANQLLEAGLWAALRTRPFDRVPAPTERPEWLFITAAETEPLAPDPALAIAAATEAFADGVRLLSALSRRPLLLCHGPNTRNILPRSDANVRHVEFRGPHPAGLPGTHIHHLARVSPEAHAWHISYLDVIAIGKLFRAGVLDQTRVIALGGNGVPRPRLVSTFAGASIDELLGEATGNPLQVYSGSALSGRAVTGVTAFLGRYHRQVTAFSAAVGTGHTGLVQGLMRRWFDHRPVPHQHRASRTGLLPVEAFERAWPMAAPPVLLLRSLLARDIETAQTLDCLELGEDDVALSQYLCPAGKDYRGALREVLNALAEQS